MNILVVNVYNPPIVNPQSIQIGGLLSQLAKNTSFKLHLFGADDSTDIKNEKYYASFASVYRLPKAKPKNVFYRLFSNNFGLSVPDGYIKHLEHVDQGVRHYNEKGIEFDLVVSFGNPMSSHIVGYEFSKKLRVRHIVHMSDPWASNPFSKFGFLNRLINKRLEKKVFESVWRVLFTSNKTMSNYKETYAIDGCRVIGHSSGYSTRVIENVHRPDSRYFTIRHIGSFYGKRSPINFLRCFRRVYKNGDMVLSDGRVVRLEFVGSISPFIKLKIRLLGLSRYVNFMGGVSYDESLKLMKGADCLLLIDANIPGSEFYPSKLADYLDAGRPILAITPQGESADILAKFGYGVVDPKDTEKIENLVRNLSKSASIYEPNPKASKFVSIEENAKELETAITHGELL